MQEKLKQQSQKDRSNSPNISIDANETDDDKSILDDSSLQEGDSFLDSRVLGTQSTEELEGLRVQISPEKVLNLPYLSQAQTKALTGITYSPEKLHSVHELHDPVYTFINSFKIIFNPMLMY